MESLQPNEIYLVYQDCPMCGSHADWGKKQTEVADKYGFKIIEKGFTEPGVSAIIKAVCLGNDDGVKILPKKPGALATLPFFTDLKHFSKNLEDFVEEEAKPKPAAKPRRKTRKAK